MRRLDPLRSSSQFARALFFATTILVSFLAWAGLDLGANRPAETEPLRTPGPIDRLEPEFAREPILPIPTGPSLDPPRVELGEALFHDPRLSRDGTVSCRTCHDLDDGGDHGQSRSTGVYGREGVMNAPTVFNASLNFRQFWDGRADSLEDQIDGPLHDPNEMDLTWPELLERLEADERYREQFRRIYPDGITAATVRDAIASFERSLLTPNGRFDRYLRGDATALSDVERRGYSLFKEVGCVTCHQGVNVGGNMFQRFGVMRNYYEDRGDVNEHDLGRFNITGDPSDRFKFKVPSLRNISLTSPYLHDGSIESLRETVQIMGNYQLGEELSPDQLTAICAFLESLTGEVKERE